MSSPTKHSAKPPESARDAPTRPLTSSNATLLSPSAPGTARPHTQSGASVATSGGGRRGRRHDSSPPPLAIGLGSVGLGAKCHDDYQKLLKARFREWLATKDDVAQTKRELEEKMAPPPTSPRERFEQEQRHANERRVQLSDQQYDMAAKCKREKEARKKEALLARQQEIEFATTFVADAVNTARKQRQAIMAARKAATTRPVSPRQVWVDQHARSEREDTLEKIGWWQDVREQEQAQWRRSTLAIHDSVAHGKARIAKSLEASRTQHQESADDVRRLIRDKKERFAKEKATWQESIKTMIQAEHDHAVRIPDEREEYLREQVDSIAEPMRRENTTKQQDRRKLWKERTEQARVRALAQHAAEKEAVIRARAAWKEQLAKRAEDIRIEEQRLKNEKEQYHQAYEEETSETIRYVQQIKAKSPTRTSEAMRSVSPPAPIPARFKLKPRATDAAIA